MQDINKLKKPIQDMYRGGEAVGWTSIEGEEMNVKREVKRRKVETQKHSQSCDTCEGEQTENL